MERNRKISGQDCFIRDFGAQKRRTEVARTALIRLRQGKVSEDEIESELVATQYRLRKEVERGKFKESWQGTNLNRTFIVIGVNKSSKTGSRPLLLAGAVIQLGGLMTMGGLGTASNPTFEIKTGIVAMISVFAFGFSLGWAPLTYFVTPELPSLRLRDQSQCFASLANVVTA